jgi:hypothetical protein
LQIKTVSAKLYIAEFIYLTSYEKTVIHLKGIGSLFNMNHATILHGLKTYKNLTDVNDKQLKTDTEYYELLLSLEKPEVNLYKEIKQAKNLKDLRVIQSRLLNKFY